MGGLMGLKELFDKIPKPTRKQLARSQKRRRKQHSRMKDWVKRPGHYLLSTGNTHCLVCGKIEFGHRMGCSCWTPGDNSFGVEYGAMLNTGTLGSGSLLNPIIQQSVFISYRDLKKRIIAGERFMEVHLCRRVTIKDFNP